jgi:hypothetical protein
MLKFTDNAGRNWDLKLTYAGARRIDNSDFSAVCSKPFSIVKADEDFFREVLTNVPLAVSVVWAIIYPQAEANGISSKEDAEAEFLESLDGSKLTELQETLWEAITDFFPEKERVLLSLSKVVKDARKSLLENYEKRIQPEMDKQVSQAIEKATCDLIEDLSEMGGEM